MKKLFCIIRTQLRCIFRRRGWRVLVLFGIAVTFFFFWYPYAAYGFDVYLMGQTVFGQAVLALCFLSMGIELRRESRREHIDDLIAAYSQPAAFFPFAQVLALALVAAAVTLIILLGFLVPLAAGGLHSLLIRQTMLQTVLLYFLPCLALSALGLLLSHLIPGKNVYLAAVVLWLPTSSLAVYFTNQISHSFPGYRLFSNLTNMGQNNHMVPWNFVSDPPIEVPRWVARGVFCAFFICLYIVFFAKDSLSGHAARRAKWGAGAVLLCGVAAVSLLCVRYGVFFAQFANDDLTGHLTFEKYMEYQDADIQPADKNITLQKADISLSCTTQGLAAQVTLTATADSAVQAQAFTLFSDFTVEEVLVDGESAAWERAFGSVQVQFPAPKAAGEEVCFTFRYHGYGLPEFPVNETTVQLGHSFPWLPWPGAAKCEPYQSDIYSVADWQQGDLVQYTLRYKGPGNLYTNLTDAGDGVYQGVSDAGVTLYSGMLHSRWQDVDIYVPPVLYEDSELFVEAVLNSRLVLLDVCERMGAPKQPLEAPSSIIVIRASGSPQNELYSWGNIWEVHVGMSSDSAVWAIWRRAKDAQQDFQSSPSAMVRIGLPYLFSPFAGYPAGVPWFSTDCLQQLMGFALTMPESDIEDIPFYMDMFLRPLLDQSDLDEYGVSLPDTPVEESARQLEAILGQMHEGKNFETQLRALYQRLLRGEGIAPAEMVQILYDSLE